MIKSTFIGRIGKDGARVIEGSNGNFLTMDVATDIRVSGETKPMWGRVRSNNPKHMGKLVEYLTKGKLIEISGIQTEPSVWMGKDGQPHAQVVIIANTIEFVSTAKKNGGETQEAQGGQGQQTNTNNIPDPTNPTMPFPAQAPNDNADDLPF